MDAAPGSLLARLRLDRWLSTSHELRGIPVRVLTSGSGASRDRLLGQLDAALRLIEVHQPRRMRRMRRDFARIWVRRHPLCRAAFHPAQRTCVLDSWFVGHFPEAQIASSIVHESVHARIRQPGRRLPADQLAREERLCREAELRFGLVLPEGGEEVVRRARETLSLSDAEVAPAIDWSAAARRTELARIDALPLPAWAKRRLKGRIGRR